MAEVVAAVAQPACEFGRCLWVPIAKRINYAKNLSKNWENLCKKTSELGTRRDDIDAKIELVKTQKTPTKECEEWKKNIEEMEKEIQTRRPEFEDEKKCLRGLCPNIFARIELGGRVVNMIYDVEKLLEKSKFENGFLTDSPPPNVEKKSIPDSLTTSSFNTMEKILDKIREETTPKIGIWGMGGIGKTTVMQLLNNTPEITTMFNFVIWVTVSKSWNIGKIQEEVGKRLSIDTTNESNERVASKLLQKLEGKKYLLLLDDVWQEVDLNVVGFPNANKENGCKVVLTTRKLEVCRKMETDYEIKVGGLPEKEAWEIFNLRVGNVAKSPTIRQYAEEIVKKCGGLPLALKVVGGALRKKNNENVWRQFLKDLKSPAKALIEDVNVEVFKSLKVSYDYLTDIEQKNCLLFCGLYPEDKEIEKSTLIGYWRADGLLSGKLTLTDARVKGDVILEDLIDASLLEKCDRDDDNDYVKMHDVIRDLVLGMTSPEGEECIHMVRSGTSAETMPEDEEWEKATRISFMDNQHLSNLSKSPDCPMLLTLLLRGCHNLKVISESFFDNMRRLHVLDLSRTGINSLPVSISKLIVLRELLLNDCLNLKVLPVELSELKSLEVFEVTKAKLDRLHLWIFELTNLKRLKIKDMRKSDDSFVDSEQVLVPGLISKTSQMEEFCVPNFFKDFGISDKSEDIVASELSSFSSLSSLDINFLSVSNLQYFLRNSRSWRERKLTEFRFCISPREMICGSQRYKKCLTYEGGRGEDHSILPWAIEDVLSRSNAFNLMDHGELTTLSDLGAQNTYELKFCHVDYCDMLENVVNGNGLEMDAFGNLEILELISLRNLKWILEMEGPPPPLSLVANSFTNLTKLYLCECPMIKHVFSNGFMIQQLSNLAMLVIRHCYGLEGMLSEDENIEYEALPKLKEVQLCVLPKFVSFFKGVAMCWKSLELVEISCCSKLRKLPLNVNSGTNLKRIQVTNRKFWDALEWDNNATKLRFQPLVIDLIWSHLFPTH